MNKSFSTKALAGFALLSMLAPAAMAQPSNAELYRRQAIINQANIAAANDRHHHHRDRDRNWNNGRYNNRYNNNAYWSHNSWNKHNWDDQRDYLRRNWKARRAYMNAVQQQQLDAQLRQQWLMYHNNNWNGGYGWNQYSDPAFLDYVHTNNPSLLNTLRNALGF